MNRMNSCNVLVESSKKYNMDTSIICKIVREDRLLHISQVPHTYSIQSNPKCR